ncbi:hypothetical protein LCGC14_0709390 [marine sediment metagenome]|uniref:Uncharacterized protein n=1 Tax=marine sediment metagenome TaxID=412755 RepID=A0A0F9R0Y9_9ZZZZ
MTNLITAALLHGSTQRLPRWERVVLSLNSSVPWTLFYGWLPDTEITVLMDSVIQGSV